MGLFKYINDTRGELKHVAWPTQKQTVIFTALVIGVSLLTALYLGLFDFVFTRVLEVSVGGQGVAPSVGIDVEQTNTGPVLPEGLDFTTTGVEGSEMQAETGGQTPTE